METSTPAPAVVSQRRAAARFGARKALRLAAVLLVAALLIPSDGHHGAARAEALVDQAISGERFNLAAWEAQAIGQKVRDAIQQPGKGLSPQEESDLVLGYMKDVGRVAQLTGEIERAASGVGEGDLAQKQATLSAELEQLRGQMEGNRPAVERILEKQVASVLDEYGFTTAGQVLPPVSFQFTESPNYLFISPRERIRVERGVYLDPALPLERIEQIEAEVAGGLEKSALVEGTGGFSSYPTMVLQYEVLGWVVDTIAHEWAHTYLFFRPLGWNYESSGAMRTINETVASIVGGEVSRRVLEKYYPELVGPAPWPRPLNKRADWLKQERVEPEFEFGAFMRETRLQADALLAEGKIGEAEQYMEKRRLELADRGYAIRKLNQAYFAFHGSYQVGASAGTDPIGGKLRALRLRSETLPQFLNTVARFDRGEDLDAALSEAAARPNG
jgi:hypothetical protein